MKEVGEMIGEADVSEDSMVQENCICLLASATTIQPIIYQECEAYVTVYGWVTKRWNKSTAYRIIHAHWGRINFRPIYQV